MSACNLWHVNAIRLIYVSLFTCLFWSQWSAAHFHAATIFFRAIMFCLVAISAIFGLQLVTVVAHSERWLYQILRLAESAGSRQCSKYTTRSYAVWVESYECEGPHSLRLWCDSTMYKGKKEKEKESSTHHYMIAWFIGFSARWCLKSIIYTSSHDSDVKLKMGSACSREMYEALFDTDPEISRWMNAAIPRFYEHGDASSV